MPEYLHPGVYVEEVAFRSRAIDGVPTSTAALLGVTERGPLQPVRVNGFGDFERWFGRQPDGGFMPDAVRGFFDNGGRDLVVCRVIGAAAATAGAGFGGWRVQALGPGRWGNRVWARVDRRAGMGVRLRLAWWEADPPGGLFDPFDEGDDARRRRAAAPPTLEEDFDGVLPGHPGPVASALVALQPPPGGAAEGPPEPGSAALTGGSDALPTVADFEGGPGGGQGLAALDDSPLGDEVSLLAAPGAPVEVARALAAQAERSQRRLAVLDVPQGFDATTAPATDLFGDNRWAAAYLPWLRVAPGPGAAPRTVPPSGHVLGCCARVDAERGVWKAPANLDLRGVVGLASVFNAAQAEALAARGFNVIRSPLGRGIRVMGARTLSSETEHRYVPVRRFLIFVQRSIERGLMDVVFEHHGETLWRRVAARVDDFLQRLWRDGAMQGQKAGEAWFVRCDRSTMSQHDIDQGRLIVLVGVAPVKPAEFVIFRVGVRTADTPT